MSTGLGEDRAEPAADHAADAELAVRLRLVAGRLHRRLRETSSSGLTPSQMSALVSISRHGPVRLGDLAAREAVAAPTLSRIVARLEDLGLVARAASAHDGRSSTVVSTAAGLAMLEEVRRERTALLRARLADLDPGRLAALRAGVEVLEELLEETGAAPGPETSHADGRGPAGRRQSVAAAR